MVRLEDEAWRESQDLRPDEDSEEEEEEEDCCDDVEEAVGSSLGLLSVWNRSRNFWTSGSTASLGADDGVVAAGGRASLSGVEAFAGDEEAQSQPIACDTKVIRLVL